MTPKELDEIVKGLGGEYGDTTSGQDTLVAEIRRLWAERDARAVVGGPVSEERLAEIRADSELYDGKLGGLDSTRPELLQHIAFLERILADADDFPRARRTGYADGWRAGLEAMADQVQVRGTEQWNAMYGRRLAEDIRKLAEEGPP